MAIKKLPDPPGEPSRPCMHPEHNLPGHIVLRPGTYEHYCPGCGKREVFTVRGVIC